jgi:outer membrane murein-binding lipoprotein Lpp
MGPMSYRSPLLAAALGSLLLAGCGSENTALIPRKDADQLTALVSEAGDASASGECDRARAAVGEAQLRLAGLPRKTDRELKSNLKQWLEHLESRIARECKAPEPDKTPEPTPTEAPETPTPTPTETAEPEPTETATPEPTVTVDPGLGGGTGGEAPPEEPAGSGGVGSGDDG